MCHEAVEQMEIVLEKVEPCELKSALMLLAQTSDKNFKNVGTTLTLMEKVNAETNKKLDFIILNIEESKLVSKKELSDAVATRHNDCVKHRKEIEEKFKKLEAVTEDLSYFKRNPKIFLTLAIGVIAVIFFLLGTKFPIADAFKIIK